MSEALSLARPYAKAIFEVALDKNALQAWSVWLNQLAFIAKDTNVQYAVSNPEHNSKTLLENILSVMDERDETLARFVSVLLEAKRFALLPEILSHFEHYKALKEQELNVAVTTAMPMSDEDKTLLNKALQQRFKQSVNLTYDTDESLLGGAIVRIDDLVIDGSGRGRLSSLKQYLEGNTLCH